MRRFLTGGLAVAAICLLISPAVHAENIFESIVHAITPHQDPPPASDPAPASPDTVIIEDDDPSDEAPPHHRHKPGFAHRYIGKPVLSEDEKYLSSASFSQRFAVIDETMQKETDDAIEYLMAHDQTLKRGDALVTQAGVVIFDPDWNLNGRFMPIDHEDVSPQVRERITSYMKPMTPAGPDQPVTIAVPLQDENPPAPPNETVVQKTRAPDGRTIRFVGGSVPQENTISPPQHHKRHVTVFTTQN